MEFYCTQRLCIGDVAAFRVPSAENQCLINVQMFIDIPIAKFIAVSPNQRRCIDEDDVCILSTAIAPMQCCMPPVALAWWLQSGNMLRFFSGLITLSYHKTNCQLAPKAVNQRTNAGSGRACPVAEEREDAGLCKDQKLRRIECAWSWLKCWERPCVSCCWRAWRCRPLRSSAAPNK